MQELKCKNAILILEDKTYFWGYRYGINGKALGEIVFSTAMTGYQETLTDPSYVSQLVVQTFPHIGNTGVNKEDDESRKIWLAGYIIKEPSRCFSNWRASDSLEKKLKDENIVCIYGVDTRAITKRIRSKGTMKAGIFSIEKKHYSDKLFEKYYNQILKIPNYSKKDLFNKVTTNHIYKVKNKKLKNANLKVAILDLGIKYSAISQLRKRGLDLYIFPSKSNLSNLLSIQPDGIFFSSGPGNPSLAKKQIILLRKILKMRIPFFGICLGNQILGHALGFQTYKLKYGHRGINQPVIDKQTGSVMITAHNHGYAVKIPTSGIVQSPYQDFGHVIASHINLNDNVVEGLRCINLPAFSVQYHPEASAGPNDSSYLFDNFIKLMLYKNTNFMNKKVS